MEPVLSCPVLWCCHSLAPSLLHPTGSRPPWHFLDPRPTSLPPLFLSHPHPTPHPGHGPPQSPHQQQCVAQPARDPVTQEVFTESNSCAPKQGSSMGASRTGQSLHPANSPWWSRWSPGTKQQPVPCGEESLCHLCHPTGGEDIGWHPGQPHIHQPGRPNPPCPKPQTEQGSFSDPRTHSADTGVRGLLAWGHSSQAPVEVGPQGLGSWCWDA